VLAVLYLMFNEGYLASADGPPTRRDLTADAAALTGLLGTLYPRHAETLGLLALIRLHLARSGRRFTAQHDLVLLPDQDRGRLEGLPAELDGYHLYHAVRGHVLVEPAGASRPGRPSCAPWPSPRTAPSSPCSGAAPMPDERQAPWANVPIPGGGQGRPPAAAVGRRVAQRPSASGVRYQS
jgi:Family of unknown function (DUF6596)